MHGGAGALALAITVLLVNCRADTHQESEVNGSQRTGDRFDANGQKGSLDHLEGGLVRQVRESGPYGFVPYLMTRRLDIGSRLGGKRDQWPVYNGYYSEGLPKRNFDEIDRSDMDGFVKKRNFDEIDQSSMPFPFKRFYHLYGTNSLNVDSPVSSFDKKRYRADYPMDEIDLSHFPIGSKRSQDGYQPQH